MLARLVALIITLSVLLTITCGLARAEGEIIPTQLQEWEQWLLKDYPQWDCPLIAQQKDRRLCAWPGVLQLEIARGKATFRQDWKLHGESVVTLPGSAEQWPYDVRIVSLDGDLEGRKRSVAVVYKGGKPTVTLEPGSYRLSGSLGWQEQPQYLSVPKHTALLSVRIGGKHISNLDIDSQGRLWIKRPSGQAKSDTLNNHVQAEVYRRLIDGVPVRLVTELRMAVAGKPREIELGRLLPANAEVTDFVSPLPARIEPDGKLRMQARAGQWTLRLEARFTSDQRQFVMRRQNNYWPAQEFWSISDAPALRGIRFSGAETVDPSQVDIPPAWKKLPTYLLRPDNSLDMAVEYRGDTQPSPNKLTLSRQLWLDFSGAGSTVKDNIRGVINTTQRLNASPELALGRVSVNGEAQLVTTLPGDGEAAPHGIEIRQRDIKVEAVSRLREVAKSSASGWEHRFDNLNWLMHLPPGWKLWHAAGPDKVSTSWLSQWNLWDMFLCLLIIAGISRLLGWRWGALGAFALLLTYHESNAPLAIWLVIIVTVALLSKLPDGRLRRWTRIACYLSFTSLLFILLDFSVQQIRYALYPQLSHHVHMESTRLVEVKKKRSDKDNRLEQRIAEPDRLDDQSAVADVEAQAPQAPAPRSKRKEFHSFRSVPGSAYSSVAKGLSLSPNETAPFQRQNYVPPSNVQTGPGQPKWRWGNMIHLNWSGPVRVEDNVRLFLSPPWLTRTLSLLQVFLLIGLGVGLARYTWRLPPGEQGKQDATPTKPAPQASAATTALIMFCLMSAAIFGASPAAAQSEEPDVYIKENTIGFPPEYLLDDYKDWLNEAPLCVPSCAAIDQLKITVDDDELSLELMVSAAVASAVPVPVNLGQWQPQSIKLNGRHVTGAVRNASGVLLLDVPDGNHRLSIKGVVKREQLSFPFALPAYNVDVSAPGWLVSGLQKGHVPGGSLRLEKVEKTGKRDTLLPEPASPFVILQRQFVLDLDWRVITTITRLAPQQGAINLSVPLLADESVVTPGMSIDGDQLQLTLAAGQRSLRWESVLPVRQEWSMKAGSSPQWVERWQVSASSRWHVSSRGLDPIKPGSRQTDPLWYPWPDEKLLITAVQPKPVPGPTTTVEMARLETKVGQRGLELALRSSIGGDYRLRLVEDAEFQRLSLNGKEQVARRDGDQVIIPLRPGQQTARLEWLLPGGAQFRTTTPGVELAGPASNVMLSIRLPADRWPLLVGGPIIGPAVLYWSILFVIAALAVGLGKTVDKLQLSIPVRTWQWLLLGIGLSTVTAIGGVMAIAWFFALEARKRYAEKIDRGWHFNLMQICLALLTIATLSGLLSVIPYSLLSSPDMHIVGNGSHGRFFNWYQDLSDKTLPVAWVVSMPIWVYRIAMLLWSLWVVFALVSWSRWGWEAFSSHSLWRPRGGSEGKKKNEQQGKPGKTDQA